jgi:hypothetical protein
VPTTKTEKEKKQQKKKRNNRKRKKPNKTGLPQRRQTLLKAQQLSSV